MTPLRPDAVVFDLDGVLIDSEGIWARAEEQVVADLGFEWDPAVRPLLHGKGTAEAATVLTEFLGGAARQGRRGAAVTAEQVAAAMATRTERLFAEGVAVNEGVIDFIKALSGRVPLAVATNSGRVLAEHALIGNGLDRWFDTIVTADDVLAPKPAPDPYLLACQWLGARPGRSVAIEDSIVGMTSAKAAGLWVIGYIAGTAELTGASAHDVADETVESFADIDLVALLGTSAAHTS